MKNEKRLWLRTHNVRNQIKIQLDNGVESCGGREREDNYFLMIHAERCTTKDEFIPRAKRWQDTWNFFRPHNGKGRHFLFSVL